MSWKPRTAKVSLYQGDYQQRIFEAGQAAEAAETRLRVAREAEKKATAGPPRTLDEVPTDEPPSVALEAEFDALAKVHDDLVAEAKAEGLVEVTLQALPRLEWDEMVEANPPRTDESVLESVREADAETGVNEKALSSVLVPASIVSISGNVAIEDLIAGASSVQWQMLYGAAFALNRSLGADPKDAPRLRPSPSTTATAS